MNRVIAAVIENASVAMSDNEAAAKKARPITLRDAVAHVRLVNRAATQWREIMHEGIGLKALLRDELSHILDIALDTPFDAVYTCALLRDAPRDECMYPGHFPGYYPALTTLAAHTSYSNLFAGALPAYIHDLIQRCRPSQIAPHADEVDLADWTSINNKIIREALRWLCYTLAHPFFVVSVRMKVYGGVPYGSLLSSLKTIVANEGWTGLFKGHSVVVLESIVALTLGEQFVPLLDFIAPLYYVKARLALDTGAMQSPFAMANKVYAEGGILRFFSGMKASLFSMPWFFLCKGLSEATLLLTFGFVQHKSPRTVPQRTRTALRRLLFGERDDDRKARIEQFKKEHGTVSEILGTSKAAPKGDSSD